MEKKISVGCGDGARQGVKVIFVAILYGIKFIFPSSVHIFAYILFTYVVDTVKLFMFKNLLVLDNYVRDIAKQNGPKR
jgi:hypothetical protein